MIKKPQSVCLLFMLFSFNVFAMDTVVTLPGSLNIKQIQRCEAYYKKTCAISKKPSPMEMVTKQWSCIEEKMQHDRSCNQAYMIRKSTNYPPNKMVQYKKGIVVFDITTIADGQTMFYIADNNGRVISLTDDEKIVAKNPTYIKLKKKYPELSFTTFVHWTHANHNQFPNYISKGKQGSQLVFEQELRDGPCVACAPIATASVAYLFRASGNFYNIKVLEVKPL